MTRYGVRTMTVTTGQSSAGTALLDGPLMVCGWSFNDGATTQGAIADQSAAAPAAGATIASLSLPNGTYMVQWWLEITGTPGAGDIDNVALDIGATQIDQSVNAGAVGNYGPFTAEAVVSGGPLTLAAKAIGAATAGSVYKVKLTVTSTGLSGATLFDSGQQIGFTTIPQGGSDTHGPFKHGIAVRTKILVQATQGIVQGVIWYTLPHEYDPDEMP